MIGQTDLQVKISEMIDNKFPRFSIFVGVKGSGKKTFVREKIIMNITDGLYEECGIRADDIRQLIIDAYKIHSTAVYFIPDADNISVAAMNALLKVTEEPPNNAYFVMTLQDENNIPETIKSRAFIFYMDVYTIDELRYYAEDIIGLSDKEAEYAVSICNTPGELNLLKKYGVFEFRDYVRLVVDNISRVSLANALKIPQKLAIKESGYDIALFWKAVCQDCLINAQIINNLDGIQGYLNSEIVTSKYIQKLRMVAGNKQMLVDNWILEIREIWM